MYTGLFYISQLTCISFGTNWDLLCQCIIYFWFGIELSELIIKQHSKVPNKTPKLHKLIKWGLLKLRHKRITYTDQVNIDKKVRYIFIGNK